MIHRHLDYVAGAPDELPSAALVDILERGDVADWRALAVAVASNPTGELARRIERLAAAYPSYGTSTLWRAWIDRCRARREGMLRGTEAPPTDLASLRRERGLTQTELAERLGMSQSDLSKFERREDVRLSTLRAYADGLGGRLSLQYVDREGRAEVAVGAACPPRSSAVSAHPPVAAHRR